MLYELHTKYLQFVKNSFKIKLATDLREGYCLLHFDMQNVGRNMTRGHTRLHLTFSEELKAPINVIVYDRFPSLFQIDLSRKVIL